MSDASIFVLDPRLETDSFPVAELKLATLRLMDDSRFPWVILVPRRPGLAELIDLDPADRAVLTGEIDAVSRALRSLTDCDKLNVAALGNMVRQLHVHVIARFEGDAAWPGAVWGAGGERQSYGAPQAMLLAGRLRGALAA
ncbi:HIT domain-containing protein [Ancylobacter dichloromethanicus]|uniref:Histidine triad protein n=1 Tax=Ancylobacter dichloromethanicus TaxID=518825 RepID=A0A9W6JBW0_9HYPH|nr:HIT family protein [Ancylobacter dichloromethanicus]MBS7553481.1 HIT domain-containing protein [Ancylobacter dichloromethanicus]GLK74402.1 histidine triad protein [Ancylobacter dichloromethanicus]